jgi:hypothetical protein
MCGEIRKIKGPTNPTLYALSQKHETVFLLRPPSGSGGFLVLQRLNQGWDGNISKAKIIVALRPVTNLTAQKFFLTI